MITIRRNSLLLASRLVEAQGRFTYTKDSETNFCLDDNLEKYIDIYFNLKTKIDKDAPRWDQFKETHLLDKNIRLQELFKNPDFEVIDS